MFKDPKKKLQKGKTLIFCSVSVRVMNSISNYVDKTMGGWRSKNVQGGGGGGGEAEKIMFSFRTELNTKSLFKYIQ